MEPRVVLTGVQFGESARWHEGRFWFSDWAKREIVAVGADGTREVVLDAPGAEFGPACIDWLPDGRLLLVSGQRQALLRQEPDGSLATHADLTNVFPAPQWNDIAVDPRGNVFLNNIAFQFPGGEFQPGIVAVVPASGPARVVAEGFAFPNGMAVTPDGSTLIVAESYAHQLTAFDIATDGGLTGRRIWAGLGDAAPDGVCVDAEGAVWYADVPHQHCRRVREGGEVLATIELDLGCFDCALGGPDGRTLYIVAADYSNPAAMFSGPPTGRIYAADLP
jgi:sugar lactone lactonase YvrE